MPNPGLPPRSASSSIEAATGLLRILVTVTVIAVLYLARELFTPLAMAVLLAFLLIPLVKRMERRIGRVASVIVTMTGMMAILIGGGWLLTNQALDLAKQLPGHKKNLSAKIQTMKPTETNTFAELERTMDDLKHELNGESKEPAAAAVTVVERGGRLGLISRILGPLSGPLGTLGLIGLLTTFMLLRMEDLQSRLVSLFGQGRISTTSKALDDASHRVRKYLFMQLIVNATYGLVLGLGLLVIGIPNAMLWGALAFVLRFVPYVGPWIAAAFPVALSLAISPDWTLPLYTILLFVTLELLSNNVMEPMLYGSSTGVSSFALIVAAIFWTWLWGPIGLVLATPLTVLLVVMGQHIPRMAFLSVLLSERQALSPADDIYLRLLRAGDQSEVELVDEYLEDHEPDNLFDEVLMPVLGRLEDDVDSGALTGVQRQGIHRDLLALLEEIELDGPKDGEIANTGQRIAVWCVPVRASRDVIAGHFLAAALEAAGFAATPAPSRAAGIRMIREFEEDADGPDIVLVSAAYPTRFPQAASLIRRIRHEWPEALIVLGSWGGAADELPGDEEAAAHGVEAVVATVSEAVAFVEGFAAKSPAAFQRAPIPGDEVERLDALHALAIGKEPGSGFEAEVSRLAGKLSMPTVSLTLVDEDSQIFLCSTGLPEVLREQGRSPRDESVCGHVVGMNHRLVVEDTLKDRRFAGNPLLREHGLRFYAGVPVRAANGQPIGSLCVMDTKPRRISRADLRLLERTAKEVSERLAKPKPVVAGGKGDEGDGEG